MSALVDPPVEVPVPGQAPLTASDRLELPRGARLHCCAVRGVWTLLVPERVLYPCPITTAALQRLDEGTLGDLAGAMAAEHNAPPEVVLRDLGELLAGLMERGYVRRAHA